MPSTRSLGSGRARGRDRAAGAPPRPGARGAPARRRAAEHGGAREWAWPAAAGALGFAALLFSTRGAPLGTPAADDYYYLYALAFRPLDVFDSMGSPIYWRPLSRQLYFLLTGHWMVTAPAGIAVLHAVLLALLFVLLYRSARHAVEPPLAAAIALFPIASEPVRVLLSWPTGAEHLLRAAFAALALHETLGGRRWTAALAALAAALSHEAGVFTIPLLPLVAWFRTRRRDATLRFGLAAAIAALAWALGYALAFARGVTLPADSGRPPLVAGLVVVFARSLSACLNLEDVSAPAAPALLAGHAALLLAAIIVMARPAARARVAAWLPPIVGGAVWAAVGIALLAFVLPDWNGWRVWVPSIGFGVAATLALGAAARPLAAGFVALRLVALLLAPPAPAVVTTEVPRTTSNFSFTRLSRLQLTVESTRRALRRAFPSLPRGAAVRFWTAPRGVQLGFQDSLATQLWYRDTTLTWASFGGNEGMDRRVDVLLEFLKDERWPATVIEPAALAPFREAWLALDAHQLDRADSLLAIAERERRVGRGGFLASVALNRAIIAGSRQRIAVAESLVHRSLELNPQMEGAWLFAARLALARGDRDAAVEAVVRCLAIDGDNAEGRRIAAALGLR
jgi:hypothetical protein